MGKNLRELLNDRKAEIGGDPTLTSHMKRVKLPDNSVRLISGTNSDFVCENAETVREFNNDIFATGAWNMMRHRLTKKKKVARTVPVIHESRDIAKTIEDET